MESLEALSAPRELRDFTTDARLVRMTAMAVVIGVMSAFVAYALVWLIGSITNLAYYHRFSSDLVRPRQTPLAGGVSSFPWSAA